MRERENHAEKGGKCLFAYVTTLPSEQNNATISMTRIGNLVHTNGATCRILTNLQVIPVTGIYPVFALQHVGMSLLDHTSSPLSQNMSAPTTNGTMHNAAWENRKRALRKARLSNQSIKRKTRHANGHTNPGRPQGS